MTSKSSKKQPVQHRPQNSARAVLTAPLPIVLTPAPRLVGYARVSTEDQSLDLQTAALRAAGVNPEEDLFEEKISAVNSKRPMFHVMMKHLWPGDTLIVYSTSRLARDLETLQKIARELKAMGVTLRSLTEPQMNTTTATGRLMFNITGAFDQFEREKIRERTSAGMQELKRQGYQLGRPRRISDKDKADMKRLRKTLPAKVIAKKYGIAIPTFYLYSK